MNSTSKVKGQLVTLRSKLFNNLTTHLNRLEEVVVQLRESQQSNEAILQRIEQMQYTIMKYDSTGVMYLSEKEVATKIFNDLIMYLDPRDMAVVPHIVLERIWEREITYAWLSVLEHNVRSDPVVVDIGANFAYYGMLAAQMNKKRGRVVFFEANPNLLYYIHKTLSVNWLNENTLVENLAVSDKQGFAELTVLKDYLGSSSMHSVDHLGSYLQEQMSLEADETIKVPTISLDAYCEARGIKKIDLIKMDIEGYEDTAYAGMAKIVKNSPNLVLFIEFTKGSYKNPKQFYERLISDFGNVYTIGEGGRLERCKDNSYQKVIAADEEILIFLVFSKRPLTEEK